MPRISLRLVLGAFLGVAPAVAQEPLALSAPLPSELVAELESLIAPVPPEQIERAAGLMSHADAAVREAAARAVSRLDVAASRHFALLQKIAQRTERYRPPPQGAVVLRPMWAGGWVPAVEPPTEAALLAAIAADPASRECLQMLAAVSERAGYSESLCERILGLAAHEDRDVRRAAVKALAVLGAWDEVGATITALLKDDDAEVRAAAVSALSRLKAPDLDALRALLLDPESRVREGACRALGASGEPTPSIVRDLVTMVRDRSPEVAGAAASALARLAVFSPEALDAVRWALSRTELPPRSVPVLGYCETAGRRASDLLPLIDAKLGAAEPRVRMAAMSALYLCTPDDARGRLVLRLCAALDDESLRPHAVHLLEDLCSGAPRHLLPSALGVRDH